MSFVNCVFQTASIQTGASTNLSFVASNVTSPHFSLTGGVTTNNATIWIDNQATSNTFTLTFPNLNTSAVIELSSSKIGTFTNGIRMRGSSLTIIRLNAFSAVQFLGDAFQNSTILFDQNICTATSLFFNGFKGNDSVIIFSNSLIKGNPTYSLRWLLSPMINMKIFFQNLTMLGLSGCIFMENYDIQNGTVVSFRNCTFRGSNFLTYTIQMRLDGGRLDHDGSNKHENGRIQIVSARSTENNSLILTEAKLDVVEFSSPANRPNSNNTIIIMRSKLRALNLSLGSSSASVLIVENSTIALVSASMIQAQHSTIRIQDSNISASNFSVTMVQNASLLINATHFADYVRVSGESACLPSQPCAVHVVCRGLTLEKEAGASFCSTHRFEERNATYFVIPLANLEPTSLFVRLHNHQVNRSIFEFINGTHIEMFTSSIQISGKTDITVLSAEGIGDLRVLGSYNYTNSSTTGGRVEVSMPAVAFPYGIKPPSGHTWYYELSLTLQVRCGKSNTTVEHLIALEAPLRYMPKPATNLFAEVVSTTKTAANALSVTGGVAIPIAAMQQGVTMALLRMAECNEDALDGESLELMVHPLRFSIGSGVTAYARGAIASNLFIVPLAWGLLAFHIIPRLMAAFTDKSVNSARSAMGWPSCFLIPFGMLSEGSAMASVALVSMGGPMDFAIGCFGLVVLLASVGVWLHMLRKRIPLERLGLQRVERKGVLWFTDTRWEWGLKPTFGGLYLQFGGTKDGGPLDTESPALLQCNQQLR